MRELDELLNAYLEQRYARAGDDEKAAFHTLLSLSDPVLVGYLLQRESPPPEVAVVVQQILDRPRS